MNKNNPKYLIVHHTGGIDSDPLFDSSGRTFEQINSAHRNDPNVWLGYLSSLGYAIGYHYYIDKAGKVTQGRLDTDEGAHTRGYNTQSLGICLAGNFDLTLPTQAQIDSLRSLLLAKMAAYMITADKIFPHRHFAVKTCYGNKLADSWAADLTKPPATAPSSCQAEKDIIKAQTATISKYQALIAALKALFINA